MTLGHPRSRLWAVFSHMSCKTAEHTELVVETVLSLHCGELTILIEFRGKVGVISGGAGGGRHFAFGLLGVLERGGGSVGGISRCGWDGSRLCLTTNLRLVFPIVHVDGLGELLEVKEHGGFTNMGDFILDAVGDTIVEMVPESTFFVASDLRGYTVELHNVLSNLLAIHHRQVVQLMFRISDGVVGTKIGLEF